ncbi:MAG TPA: nitroreductase/quinone reductase family protein [Candidatus Limnocylindrales bacterium]|jgi:hypothetical protein
MAAFPKDVLADLAEREEIVIETGDGRKTIIWIVVDGNDVFVRSVRGERGRWYRELRDEPRGTIHFRGKPKRAPVAFRAVPAADRDSVARFDRALTAKYKGIPGYEPMREPETLPTTVRLEPI